MRERELLGLAGDLARTPDDPGLWERTLTTAVRAGRLEAGVALVRDALARGAGGPAAEDRFAALVRRVGYGFGDPRLQFPGRISHAVASPDGARLAVAAEGHGLTLLETVTGTVIGFHPAPGRLALLVFSARRRALAALWPGTDVAGPVARPLLVRWDEGDEGEPTVREVEAPRAGEYRIAALDPDLGRVLWTGAGRVLDLADPATGAGFQLPGLPGRGVLVSAAFAPGGAWILLEAQEAAGPDGTEGARETFFLEVATGRMVAFARETQGPIEWVFSPCGSYLAGGWVETLDADAAASTAGPLAARVRTAREEVRLHLVVLSTAAMEVAWRPAPQPGARSLRFTVDGLLRTDSALLDPRTRTLLPAPSSRLTAIPARGEARGAELATFANHLTLDPPPGQPRARGGPLFHRGPVIAVAARAGGRLLVSRDLQETVVWDLAEGRPRARFPGGKGSEPLSMAADGTRALLLELGGIRVFDPTGPEAAAGRTGGKLVPLSAFDGALSPDGARIVLGGVEGTLTALDAEGLGTLWTASAHQGGVRACGWLADGTAWSLGLRDDRVAFWTPDGAEAHRALLAPGIAGLGRGRALGAHPRVPALLGSTAEGLVAMLPGEPAPRVLAAGLAHALALAIGPDGTRVAVSTAAGEIVVLALGPDLGGRPDERLRFRPGLGPAVALELTGTELVYSQVCHLRLAPLP